MEEKNREEDIVRNDVTQITENVVSSSKVSNKTKNKSVIKTYVITAILIVVIALGLLFVLEKNDRINTGLFAGVIASMEANAPAAKVNGEVISMSELDTGVQQLMEMASLQGIDTSSEEVLAEFRSQAVETLINGEILRQTAIEKGIEVSNEDVDSRFNEISEGVGGVDVLNERMAEFGISEETLRKDIENEILIQGLFDLVFEDTIDVSDEEVVNFYEQAGGESAGLPPLEDVKGQIIEQLKLDKENQQVGTYIDELKEEADIEILI